MLPVNKCSFRLSVCLRPGIVCSQSESRSASSPVTMTRGGNTSSPDKSDYEESLQECVKKMLLLSDSGGGGTPSGANHKDQTASRLRSDNLLDITDLSVYYSALNGLLAFYGGFLTKDFLDELPKTLVCILSGGEDCGVEAESTKSFMAQMGTHVRSLLSLKSHTCLSSSSSDRNSYTSAFQSVFQIGASAMTQLVSIQEFFMSSLVYMPKYLSEYLVAGWRVFTDLTFPPLVKYLSGVVVKYVQTPIDYVKIGLQFFIKIPVLNQSGQCYQGTLIVSYVCKVY